MANALVARAKILGDLGEHPRRPASRNEAMLLRRCTDADVAKGCSPRHSAVRPSRWVPVIRGTRSQKSSPPKNKRFWAAGHPVVAP